MKTYTLHVSTLPRSIIVKTTAKKRWSLPKIVFFLTSKHLFAIHFPLATCNVCPLAIPEFFAHNMGIRLLANHSLPCFFKRKPRSAYYLSRSNNVIVPRFNSKFLKNSISYRGAILWNAVSSHYTGQFTEFYRKVKKDIYFKELDFSAQSAQLLPRHYLDFKCF